MLFYRHGSQRVRVGESKRITMPSPQASQIGSIAKVALESAGIRGENAPDLAKVSPRYNRVLSLLGWFVVPVPAALFLGVWFIAQFGLGGTNVAWEAHAGGFVFGFALTLFYRRRALRRVATGR